MIQLTKFFHLPPSTFHHHPISNIQYSISNLILILILISALAPSRGQANPPILVAEDGTFLGVASANVFAWLLARDGTPLATLRIDRTVRRLPWVPLRDIAPTLRRA